MTLQALLETMEQDGRRELAEVIAEDERRAREILQAAHRSAERDRLDLLSQAESTARAEAARLRSTGAAASRAHVHETIESELEQVRKAAVQRLQELTGTDHGRSVTLDLLDEAIALLPSATRCTVEEAHEDAVRRHQPGLVLEMGPIGIGVVLRDGEGRAVHNTAEGRLAAAWPLLRPVLRDAMCSPQPGANPGMHPQVGTGVGTGVGTEVGTEGDADEVADAGVEGDPR